jgi:uncharacterized membrane protein (Fun14 family)
MTDDIKDNLADLILGFIVGIIIGFALYKYKAIDEKYIIVAGIIMALVVLLYKYSITKYSMTSHTDKYNNHVKFLMNSGKTLEGYLSSNKETDKCMTKEKYNSPKSIPNIEHDVNEFPAVGYKLTKNRYAEGVIQSGYNNDVMPGNHNAYNGYSHI